MYTFGKPIYNNNISSKRNITFKSPEKQLISTDLLNSLKNISANFNTDTATFTLDTAEFSNSSITELSVESINSINGSDNFFKIISAVNISRSSNNFISPNRNYILQVNESTNDIYINNRYVDINNTQLKIKNSKCIIETDDLSTTDNVFVMNLTKTNMTTDVVQTTNANPFNFISGILAKKSLFDVSNNSLSNLTDTKLGYIMMPNFDVNNSNNTFSYSNSNSDTIRFDNNKSSVRFMYTKYDYGNDSSLTTNSDFNTHLAELNSNTYQDYYLPLEIDRLALHGGIISNPIGTSTDNSKRNISFHLYNTNNNNNISYFDIMSLVNNYNSTTDTILYNDNILEKFYTKLNSPLFMESVDNILPTIYFTNNLKFNIPKDNTSSYDILNLNRQKLSTNVNISFESKLNTNYDGDNNYYGIEFNDVINIFSGTDTFMMFENGNTDHIYMYKDTTVNGDLVVTGATDFSNMVASGDFKVEGESFFYNTLNVIDKTDVNNHIVLLNVNKSSGNTTIGGNLQVDNEFYLHNNFNIVNITDPNNHIITAYIESNTGNIDTNGTITLTGMLNANGGIVCDTDKFIVADTTGNTTIGGTLDVNGTTTLTGMLNANGGITCDTNKFIVTNTGNTTVGGTLDVNGTTTLTGILNANGGITCDTNKFIVTNTGNTTIGGTLDVNRTTTLTGILNANGGIVCDTDKFIVADTTGNTTIGGTLDVTGTTTLTGMLNANGGITCDTNKFIVADTTGNTTIGGTLDVTGKITIGDPTNSNTGGTINSGNGTITIDPHTVGNNSGSLIIAGDLIVNGTTTTVNSTTINIGDNTIILNNNETGIPSQNAGLEIERGTSTNVSFLWNETNDEWTTGNENLNVGGTITGPTITGIQNDITTLQNNSNSTFSSINMVNNNDKYEIAVETDLILRPKYSENSFYSNTNEYNITSINDVFTDSNAIIPDNNIPKTYEISFKSNNTTQNNNIVNVLFTVGFTAENTRNASFHLVGLNKDSNNQGVVMYTGDEGGLGLGVISTPLSSLWDNQYHHFIMTVDYDLRTVTVFIDGVNVGSHQFSNSLQLDHDGTGVRIGANIHTSEELFLGSLKNFYVYNKILSTQEIATRYSIFQGNAPPSTNNIAISTNDIKLTNATVTGMLNANGGITCDTDKFIVADTTGNTTIGGTLDVNGITTITGNLNCDTIKTVNISNRNGATQRLNMLNALTIEQNTNDTTNDNLLLLKTQDTGWIFQRFQGPNERFDIGIDGSENIVFRLGDGSTKKFIFKNNCQYDDNVTITGMLNANGGIVCDTNKFIVADTTGNTTIGGTLDVNGTTTLTGMLNANGGIVCDTNKFIVADTTGNTTIGGTLDVNGTTTLTGNLITTGTITGPTITGIQNDITTLQNNSNSTFSSINMVNNNDKYEIVVETDLILRPKYSENSFYSNTNEYNITSINDVFTDSNAIIPDNNIPKTYEISFKSNNTTQNNNIVNVLFVVGFTAENTSNASFHHVGLNKDSNNQGVVMYNGDEGGLGLGVISTPLSSLWDDQYHHFIMTVDYISRTVTAFIDGVNVGSHQFSNSLQLDHDGTGVRIGANIHTSGELFLGSLKNFYVYNKILSTQEIATRYSIFQGNAPPSTNNIAISTNDIKLTNATVTGMLNANGGITCDTDKFIVADTTGNTTIGGILNVKSTSILENTLTISSTDTTGSQLILKPADFNDRAIVSFYENDGAMMYCIGAREDTKHLIFSATHTDPTHDTTPTLCLSDNEKVGIGTNNPSSTLDVVGDAKISSTPTFSTAYPTDSILNIISTNPGNTPYGFSGIKLNIGNYNHSFGMDLNNLDIRAKGDSISGSIRMFTGNGTNQTMTLLSNGNVGIGTTTPKSALHIVGAKDNNTLIEGIHLGHNGNPDYGIDFVSGNNASGVYLDFNRTNSGIIDFVGRFYYLFSNNTFNFTRTINAPGWSSSSDDRLKHNEININNALKTIMKLSAQNYDKTNELKEEDFKGELKEGTFIKESGFIAQEVYMIDELKHLITVGDEKTPWGINYNGLFTYNIQATQELNNIVKEQKDKIDNLEKTLLNKNNIIEENKNKIDNLEKTVLNQNNIINDLKQKVEELFNKL